MRHNEATRINHQSIKTFCFFLFHSSTMAPSAESSSSSRCRKCLKLLQESLLDTSSKHYQLLQQITGQAELTWRNTASGHHTVELELPADLPKEENTAGDHDTARTSTNPSPIDSTRRKTTDDSTTTRTTAVQSSRSAPSSLLQRQNTMATSSSSPPPDTPPETLRISCRPCNNFGPEQHARAFVLGPHPLSIVLCSNRLLEFSPREVSEILVHELIHVYDVKQLQLDLLECRNLAYSEVRAAREAECQNSWHPNSCIDKKAHSATSNLFASNHARQCVDAVWEEALNDRRPFASHSSGGQSRPPHTTWTRTASSDR